MSIDDEITRLQSRFEALADEGGADVAGAEELASGLQKIVDRLDPGAIDDRDRLELIVRGLAGLADVLDSGDVARSTSDDDETAGKTTGLDQFIGTFRKDAGKRIQGLSISLMGIFGEQGGDEAAEQSADHLHAIRGGAAMLGLDAVAGVAGEMEKALKATAKLDAHRREWPTKTLMRGYALLEQAIESETIDVDVDEADEIIESLQAYLATVGRTGGDGSDVEMAASTETDVSRETTPATATSANDDRSSAQPEAGSDDEGDYQQPILVVDDVETIAASVGFILSELDVPVEVASNGEEAIQMLRQKPFSLVISDIDMPRMDGIALTQMIRSDEQLDRLPVILLTSLDHPEERQKGMEAGATDYIIKGAIGGGELLRRVKELLEVAPVVESQAHRQDRRILVAEDTETVAASIAFVLSEGPFEIMLATDGKDALRRLEKESFDLLITDLQMPFMTGTELVTAVRGDDELADLPVIMLTSVEDEDAMAEAVDAGVDRYVIKGEIAGGKLLSEVEDLLEH